MLAVSIHEHAGLGNQIWRAVCCRVFADRLGYDYAISHPGWRGPFLNFDFGHQISLNVEQQSEFDDCKELPNGILHYYEESSIHHKTAPGEIGFADENFFTIKDNTYINGNFQRMSYIEDYRDKICEWLSYDDKYKITDYSSEDICVIQIRGGDYKTGHSVLPADYYHSAMEHMRENNPNIKFVIVTDDPGFAKQMVPGVEIVGSAVSEEKDQYQKNIGWYSYPGGPVSIDYSILNNAKYAIISASTFSFWPIWTSKELLNVIAPKYWFDWSRSNGWWRPEDSIVNDERWLWLDTDGDLYPSAVCIEERDWEKKTIKIVKEKNLTESEKYYSYPIKVESQEDVELLNTSKTTGMIFLGEKEIDYPRFWESKRFKLPFNDFLLKEYSNTFFKMIGIENFTYYCEGNRVEVVDDQSSFQIEFDRVFSALNYGSCVWQHFVQDTLPIIIFAREFLEENPDVTILLYDGVNKKSISDFFLSKLNLKNPIKYIPYYSPFKYEKIIGKAKQLYMVDCNNHMPCYWWNNFFYKEINNVILNGEDCSRKNLIYLNRNETSSVRHFLNESEVVEVLKTYADNNDLNFIDYIDSNFSIEETFEVFKNAHTVIGCHGGANYNIIFCPKGTKFIEYVFTDCMYTLYNIASSIELDYYVVPNRGTNLSEGALIDLNKLQKIMEK